MTTLPLDVVTHIFQAVADSEADPFTWWAPTDAYRAFFAAAALVCRAWRDLALPHRRLFYVKPKPKQVTVEEWDREIHELAKRRICFRTPARAGQLLHIEQMDHAGPHLQVSKNLSLVFLGGGELEALSIQLNFLQPGQLRQRDEKLLLPGFQSLLRKIKRFHVYSTKKTSIIHIDQIVLDECRISWQDLAAFIWPATRSESVVQELALSTIYVTQTSDALQDDDVTIPVESLVLSDVYFEHRTEWSRLFPEVKELVLRQTTAWQARVPAFNLIWDIGDNLSSLYIVWSTTPFPLLSGNSDILKSPNLEMLDIRTNLDIIIDYQLNEGDFLDKLRQIFEEVTNLKQLTIEGIDLLGNNEEIGHFCAAFNSPSYLQALREIPRFTLHPHPDYFPTKFDISDRYCIDAGLAGLRKRGLRMAPDYLDQTVWKYILKGCSECDMD